jgi:hypothetical protein
MHRGFTYVHGAGRRRMYWKASIDLSRPLVPSMGQHDPLDGFLTCVELDATRASMSAPGPSLGDVAVDFAAMVDPARLATADALGIGGLLIDAHRVQQLRQRGAFFEDGALERALLDAASAGLEAYAASGELRAAASHRLAFRELGLAIGLSALAETLPHDPAPRRWAPLRAEVVSFWLRPKHHETAAWAGHQDINDVMLATALRPEGLLTLWPPGA